MKCLNCKSEIKKDDNFCHECGEWTSKGYSFLKEKENVDMILNGSVMKQDRRFSYLIFIVTFSFVIFVIMTIIRGKDLFRPIYYLKRQAHNYSYGYSSSIIKTDNMYNKKIVNNISDANNLIKRDFDDQSWKCMFYTDTFLIEKELEDNYSIIDVSLCDVSYEEVLKIKQVIDKMYRLFPNIEGSLTNISVTNAKAKDEYIAYFQPMYQFVNTNEDINSYNKVNKSQILLNSYYFLNDKIINKPIKDNYYVKDATLESIIAHELGHYITFKILLKENNLDNITLVNKDNYELIDKILKDFDEGILQKAILDKAINTYNKKYNQKLNLNSFALKISNYAAVKDEDDNLIIDEIIAEAIHDYYLHENSASKESLEIISVIKERLGAL